MNKKEIILNQLNDTTLKHIFNAMRKYENTDILKTDKSSQDVMVLLIANLFSIKRLYDDYIKWVK